jgi:MYXO-CTERM domain-containing protein
MSGGSGGSTGSGTGSGGSSSPPGTGKGGSGCGCDLGTAAGSATLTQIAGVLGVALAGLATRRRRKTRGRTAPPA